MSSLFPQFSTFKEELQSVRGEVHAVKGNLTLVDGKLDYLKSEKTDKVIADLQIKFNNYPQSVKQLITLPSHSGSILQKPGQNCKDM